MRLGALIIAVALTAAAVGAALLASARLDARYRHLSNGETRLRISDAVGDVMVYRTGRSLDQAASLDLPRGELWLPAANYFVAAGASGERLYYPVPLETFQRGPDSDGAFSVAIRRTGSEGPPVADPSTPGFRYIPAGHFAMGDRRNIGETRFVWVGGFFMAAFEVTNGEFRRFLGAADGYDDRSNWTADGWSWRGTGASQVTARLEASHADYRRFGLDDQPVVSVTWYEAQAYCRWLTRRLGADRWVFRLPTEAEWEKSARGPDSFDYGLGSTLSEPESGLYNWKKNPGADVTLVGWADTRKAYAPNRYGLYHASGNAAEWLRSAARPVTRAQPYEEHDGRNEDEGTADRVARGGSWYSASAVRLYLAYREEFPPNLSSNDLGFRIAAVLMPRAGTTQASGTGRTD